MEVNKMTNEQLLDAFAQRAKEYLNYYKDTQEGIRVLAKCCDYRVELLRRLEHGQGAQPSNLRALADKAYCDYIEQMRRPECLGFEQKLKEGKFGVVELDAHTHAGELLGRHRAFAEVCAQFPAAPPEQPQCFDCETIIPCLCGNNRTELLPGERPEGTNESPADDSAGLADRGEPFCTCESPHGRYQCLNCYLLLKPPADPAQGQPATIKTMGEKDVKERMRSLKNELGFLIREFPQFAGTEACPSLDKPAAQGQMSARDTRESWLEFRKSLPTPWNQWYPPDCILRFAEAFARSQGEVKNG